MWGNRAGGRSQSVLPGSGGQRLTVSLGAHPEDACGGVGGGRRGKGREGRAAHHICQVHHGLGKVAGEDHRLSHLLKLGEKRVGGGRVCFQPLLPKSLPAWDCTSWWSLITISSTYLVSLCTVGWPRRTWGGEVGTWSQSPPCLASWPSHRQTQGGAGLQPETVSAPHWCRSHPALVPGQAASVCLDTSGRA